MSNQEDILSPADLAQQARTKRRGKAQERSGAKDENKLYLYGSHNQQYDRVNTELLKSLLICHTDPDAAPNSRVNKTNVALHAGISLSTLYRHLPSGDLRQALVHAEQMFLRNFSAFASVNLSNLTAGDYNSNRRVFYLVLNFVLDNWDIFSLLVRDDPSEWVFDDIMSQIFPYLSFNDRLPRLPAIRAGSEETWLYLRVLSGLLLWWCGKCKHDQPANQAAQPLADTCVQEMMIMTSALMRGSFYLGE